MNKPVLVIMAAGMGSRYGGLKQIDPIGPNGQIILDYSVYDAHRAGFERVVFIIRPELHEAFEQAIGAKARRFMQVDYAYQTLDRLPEGLKAPEGREKPLGTAHAVWCAKELTEGCPIAVINADDFYGPGAFSALYDFLKNDTNDREQCMVAYQLRNTVTEFGSVARGICHVENGFLRDITERTKIFKRGQDAAYTEDDETFVPLAGDSLVSMNFWGFTPQILEEIWDKFPGFLEENLKTNPEKCEFYLPTVVNNQLLDHRADVRVLPCMESWYGVTYKEDLESVLDDCLALSMPQKHLLWHYRSRHESLIAYSNAKYYDNKLMTFPSPDDLVSKVKWFNVEGYYDKGGSKQNKAEGEAIIAEIVRRLSDEKLRKQSIGVVTFSLVQQNLIDDMLADEFMKNPQLEQWANEMYEPIFVKNLENVQGDERDVILFSIGYGPDKNGNVSMNFGPVNRDGGWRRLNVAISRARREMQVYSVIRPDQIDLNRTRSDGVAGLKGFLEFAAKGNAALAARTVSAAAENDDFEKIVAAEIEKLGYKVLDIEHQPYEKKGLFHRK